MIWKKRRLVWSLIAILWLLAAGGCSLFYVSGIKDSLGQAEAVRADAQSHPWSEAVQQEIEDSARHQAQAEKMLQAWDDVPLIDFKRRAKEYARLAQEHAEESLAAAQAAQNKLAAMEDEALADLEEGALDQEAAGPPEPVGTPAEPEIMTEVVLVPETSPPPQPAPEAEIKLPDDPQALYKYGLEKYYAKNYPLSRQALVTFLARYPSHNLAVNAQYWIGETYYAEKEWVMALGAFQAVLNQYSKGRKVPDALLKISLTETNLGRRARAQTALNDLLRRFPDSEPAKVARSRFNL